MKARVFFTREFLHSPMTFWVHKTWNERAITYPMPESLPGKGYASYLVRTGGFLFRFSSLEELLVCIDTLSRKHLGNPIHEGALDPTEHWLNKLPPRLKRWERRGRIVSDLRRALEYFQRETGLVPASPNPSGDHVRRIGIHARMLFRDEQGQWVSLPYGEYLERQKTGQRIEGDGYHTDSAEKSPC